MLHVLARVKFVSSSIWALRVGEGSSLTPSCTYSHYISLPVIPDACSLPSEESIARYKANIIQSVGDSQWGLGWMQMRIHPDRGTMRISFYTLDLHTPIAARGEIPACVGSNPVDEYFWSIKANKRSSRDVACVPSSKRLSQPNAHDPQTIGT